MEEIRATLKGGPDKARNGDSTTPKRIRFTSRQWRALAALVEHPRSREELDRITGASNGPEVIAQLRRRGIGVKCELVAHTDRDGKKGRHGVYWIPESEKERLGGGQ